MKTLREYEREEGIIGWDVCEANEAEFQRPANATYLPNAHGKYIRKQTDMGDELQRLIEIFGEHYAGKYRVRYTDFHQGGTISTHRSPIEAIKSHHKHIFTDCVCGCAIIEKAD